VHTSRLVLDLLQELWIEENSVTRGFRVSLEGISDNVILAQAGIYNPLIGIDPASTGVTKKHFF